ncbi:MAG TPA: DUF885 domain-containing protein [Acidimicrobiales bacterium]|nr:DUF885 domain-containing protein [Acidimicrobiales bacterium]
MPANDLATELLAAVFDADPLSASMYGFPGYDNRLPDLSEEAEARVAATLASIAQRAEAHSAQGLTETEHQTLDFVRVLARGMAEAARVPLTEFTICDTFVAPVPGVLTTLPKLPLDNEERRNGYLARLGGLPALLAIAGERHQSGARAGRTAVARLVESAVAQLDLLMAEADLGGASRADIEDDDFRRSVAQVIDHDVRPALAGYRDTLRTDVLPLARDDDHPGICFLPDGDSMYRALARLHTSTTYTPDELHAMGREIIDQVRDELVETGSRLWQTSDPAEIFGHLCDDPDLRYSSREEMLEHARRVVATAEEEAPNWFATVPDQPCTVEPVPEAEEAGMAAAYYMPGAIDGSRQGTYYLNTSKPQERHRYTAEDIAFHEAVPGHHFQLTIAMEATELPLARRVLHDTACAEGWGLYSERLADEMGLYSDDVARMGLYAADSWRASRLVVDTGLHALGWSRQQAVDWLASNTPMPRIEVESEVDRYISYPGQALAYMVGRREIVRLRQLAADRLTTSFDLRQFHDLLLGVGMLPLPALAGTVERWIERTTS